MIGCARPERPQAVGKERHWGGDHDREPLSARRVQADGRVEDCEACIVHQEADARHDAEASQVASEASSARRKCPRAEQREVEETVQREHDAEREVGGDSETELRGIEDDGEEIAARNHDPVAHDLADDVLATCTLRATLFYLHSHAPSMGASATAIVSPPSTRSEPDVP